MPRRLPDARQRLTIHSDLKGLKVLKAVRKSTLNSANPSKSVTDQMSDLHRECDRLGLVEADRIEENVQGASVYSKSLNREEFERGLRLIRTGEIAVLAYWELSRSARRQRIHGELMETLQATNTLLLIGNRLYDASDPNDQLALGVNAVMDENAVSRNRAASMRGIREAAKNGKPHGVEMYGYRRVYRGKPLERVEIVPQEAAIINEIVDRVIKGESQGSIARDLTARHIPRPRTAVWHTAEIRDIIDRDAYMGIRVHIDWRHQEVIGRYPAMWPAIVDADRLTKARNVLDSRNSGRVGGGPAKYLCTGFIQCGRCSSRVYGEIDVQADAKGVKHPVYSCRKCRLSRNMARVDQAVLDVVRTWLDDSDIIREFAAASEGGAGEELARLRAEMAEANRELDEGYSATLTARGMAALEKTWVPIVDRCKAEIAVLEAASAATAWSQLASGRLTRVIPNTVAGRRDFLAAVVRVKLLPLGRGQRFSIDCLDIRPAGVPQELPDDDGSDVR